MTELLYFSEVRLCCVSEMSCDISSETLNRIRFSVSDSCVLVTTCIEQLVE